MVPIFSEQEKSLTNNVHFSVGHGFTFTMVKKIVMNNKVVPEICLFQFGTCTELPN